MPDKPIDLSEYYDADTLRAFTADEYENRKRLYTEREAAREVAKSICNSNLVTHRTGLDFDGLIKHWSELEPAVRKYLEHDREINRLDGVDANTTQTATRRIIIQR